MSDRAPAAVCAGIVAYRNPVELHRVLQSLAEGSRVPDALLVVDNTVEESLLRANRTVFDGIAPAFPSAEYVVAESNVGSAGGFRICMEWTHRNGIDWVWLLDQDGTVGSACLESLLAVAADGDVLAPRVLSLGDGKTELGLRSNLTFWGRLRIVYSGLAHVPQPITTFATHGVLISAQAMGTIGYYDDEAYFCGWEDHDYSKRLYDAGVRTLLVPEAIVFHPDLGEKYDTKMKGHIPLARRLFMTVDLHLPMPLYFETWDPVRDERLSGSARTDGKRAYIKKHINGFRYWSGFFYSVLCLVLMKLAGRKVAFRESVRMYLHLR